MRKIAVIVCGDSPGTSFFIIVRLDRLIQKTRFLTVVSLSKGILHFHRFGGGGQRGIRDL